LRFLSDIDTQNAIGYDAEALPPGVRDQERRGRKQPEAIPRDRPHF
jgi:hypothetical protein